MATLRDSLNTANPNHVPDGLQKLPAGEAFNLIKRREVLVAAAGIAVPSVPAVLCSVAFDKTNGVYLTQAAQEVAAGAGQVSVLANGNISVDPACLAVEVVYDAVEGTLVTETLQVAASSATFLGSKQGVKVVSATVLTGVVLGAKTIARRASVPALGSVVLKATGLGLTFNAGDVVTGTVSVTYVARPTISVSQALGTTVKF